MKNERTGEHDHGAGQWYSQVSFIMAMHPDIDSELEVEVELEVDRQNRERGSDLGLQSTNIK